MKSLKISPLFYVILIVILVTCCTKKDEGSLTLELRSPTFIKESSLTINWVTHATSYDSITLEISESNDFVDLSYFKAIADPTANSQVVEGLKGLTSYFLKVTIWKEGKNIFTHPTFEFKTTYTAENINFETGDGLVLSGTVGYLKALDGKRPGIIMMHEMGNWINKWDDSEVMQELIGSGYVCMPFFFRGHGTSESIADLNELINDWSLLENDLRAAMAYLKNMDIVQEDSLGLVGGSLGGIMAIAGNGFDEVKVSVAISAPGFGYNSIFPDIVPQYVFYIAAENDINLAEDINMASEAQNMYDISMEPKKIMIISNSSKHGTILLDNSEVSLEIIKWIEQYL